MKWYLTIVFSLLVFSCSSSGDNKNLENKCALQPEIGQCRGSFPKYYFDKQTASCEVFYWGGCGGVVPFNEMAECKQLCESNSNTGLLQQLDDSLNSWNKITNSQNKTYQYSVDFSSWVGFGNRTTVHVSNENVIKREYHSWDSENNTIIQWIEEAAGSLGSHKEGAGLQTIEQLYKECRLILLEKDNADNHIYLTFDKEEILNQCEFSPKNCADDCSSGVNIQNLKFYQQ